LRTYAEETQQLSDGIIRQLMNDLYLAYWNIGDMDGEIYIYGRHSSQGNQHAYTPGNNRLHNCILGDGFETPMKPVLKRCSNQIHSHNHLNLTSVFDTNVLLDVNDDLSNGQTDDEYSCYSTPGIRNTTTSIQLFDD
jgi:hypothetical protein